MGRSIRRSRFRPWRVRTRCTVEAGIPRIGPMRAGPSFRSRRSAHIRASVSVGVRCGVVRGRLVRSYAPPRPRRASGAPTCGWWCGRCPFRRPRGRRGGRRGPGRPGGACRGRSVGRWGGTRIPLQGSLAGITEWNVESSVSCCLGPGPGGMGQGKEHVRARPPTPGRRPLVVDGDACVVTQQLSGECARLQAVRVVEVPPMSARSNAPSVAGVLQGVGRMVRAAVVRVTAEGWLRGLSRRGPVTGWCSWGRGPGCRGTGFP